MDVSDLKIDAPPCFINVSITKPVASAFFFLYLYVQHVCCCIVDYRYRRCVYYILNKISHTMPKGAWAYCRGIGNRVPCTDKRGRAASWRNMHGSRYQVLQLGLGCRGHWGGGGGRIM
jgi:hypothetical protein